MIERLAGCFCPQPTYHAHQSIDTIRHAVDCQLNRQNKQPFLDGVSPNFKERDSIRDKDKLYGELLKWTSENQGRVIVKLYGEPAAGIMPYTEYEEVEKLRMREQKRKVLKALDALRQEARRQNPDLTAEEAYHLAGFSEDVIQETLQADEELAVSNNVAIYLPI